MLEKQQLYNSFVQDFSYKLEQNQKSNDFSNFIFLCVGTDRVTGDSFGPLVGYKLKYLYERSRTSNCNREPR